MISKTNLIDLLEYYTSIKRTEYCSSCESSFGSERHHQVCLSNINKIFFYKKALRFMLNKNIISYHEFIGLDLWIEENGSSYAD